MKNIFKKILVLLSLSSYLLLADVGIVDTNVLLIKKEPSLKSVKFGFYKKDKVINIKKSIMGSDNNEKWYKTKRGYVRAAYVILEKDLPKFIDSSELDYNKYALQLIVYPSTVVESLRKLRILLKDENNLYLAKSKNVYIIYLVNFESYGDAVIKKDSLSISFPTSFISKIKNKSNIKSKSKSISKKEKLVYKEEIDNYNDEYLDESININDFNSDLNEELSTRDIEEIKYDNTARKKVSIKKEKLVIKKEFKKPIEVKTMKKIIIKEKTVIKKAVIEKKSFTARIEDILLHMDD